MFCKTSLLAVALALLTVAGPVTQDNRISIPLHKRSSLTQADGTVDYAKAAAERARTESKHRQNIATFARSLDLSDGVHGQPAANITKRQINQDDSLHGSATYRPDSGFWYTGRPSGTVGGEKSVPTSVAQEPHDDAPVLPTINGTVPKATPTDQGNDLLWARQVSEDVRKSPPYRPRSRRRRTGTSSGVTQSLALAIELDDNAQALYVTNITKRQDAPSTDQDNDLLWSDQVSVGTSAQTLASVTHESGQLQSSPQDGPMGIGCHAISSMNALPFFFPAISQNSFPEGACSMTLDKSGAELYFGRTDVALYQGAAGYHTPTWQGPWHIGPTSVLVDGQAVASGFDTIINSSTTLAYGPPDQVAQLYAAIDGAQQYQQGAYVVPCDTTASVAFSWGGNVWAISPSAFILGQVGDNLCQGAIGATEVAQNTWILGDTFMTNVYTVFSADKGTVRFAALA